MRKLLLVLFSITSLASHAQRELWGTASMGGQYNDGFIYKTDANGDNLQIVHHFQQVVDGREISALTLASNNKLYGMAGSGGINGGGNVFAGGTFFEYDLNTNTFKVLQHFGAANEALPGVVMPLAYGQTTITEVQPGVLYGVMMQGSYVFAYNINTGVFTKPFTVPNYSGGATNSTLQNKLNRGFIKASDGNFYVTTATNSVCPIPNPNMGSMMRMNAAGSSIAIRLRGSCLADDGYIWKGSLVEYNGKFFGATDYGGTHNKGVLFEYTLATNSYTKRYDLNAITSYQVQAITLAPNNKIYGVAHGGGIPEPNLQLHAGGGVLFEFDPATGAFEVKHNFTLTNQSMYDMGIFPTDLITSTNGKLYGATQYGVFEYDIETSTIRTAGRFANLGFGPSVREVCRKPHYTPQAQTTINICEGESFELDMESPNATSIVWKHNGETDVTQTTAVLQFDEFTTAHAGTWSSTLTNACGTTITQTITLVAGTPDQPMIEASGATTFCTGESITLTAPEGYETYNWSNGEDTRSINVSETGSYSVNVSNDCVSPESELITVTVNPLPSVPLLTQTFNQGIVLTASGSSSGMYHWVLNDEPVDTESNQIENAQPGVYKVYSVSEADCRSVEAATLVVVITGTESAIEKLVEVYPNPAYDNVHIKLSEFVRADAQVELYAASGKLVQHISLKNREAMLDVQSLQGGVYLLKIRVDGKIILHKIQVMK